MGPSQRERQRQRMTASITIVGNLTRDPEVGTTSGGTTYARLGLACNRRWKKDGEDQEEVSYYNATVWGDQAETVEASLAKGDRVIITGRLDQRRWEDDEGNAKSAHQIHVYDIGPSLRWATAEITKTEKSSGGRGDEAPPPDEEPF